MRINRLLLALAVVLYVAFLAVFSGCTGGAFSPSQVAHAATLVPAHHNIPATFAGHPEGPVVWLCATQPRTYCTGSSNVCAEEEDHYLQYDTCPAIPIQ